MNSIVIDWSKAHLLKMYSKKLKKNLSLLTYHMDTVVAKYEGLLVKI